MCDLEKEVKLVREKVELLEKLKVLKEIEKYPTYPYPVPYPVYPWYPSYPYPIPTYGDKTSDLLPPNSIWICSTTKINPSDRITLTY